MDLNTLLKSITSTMLFTLGRGFSHLRKSNAFLLYRTVWLPRTHPSSGRAVKTHAVTKWQNIIFAIAKWDLTTAHIIWHSNVEFSWKGGPVHRKCGHIPGWVSFLTQFFLASAHANISFGYQQLPPPRFSLSQTRGHVPCISSKAAWRPRAMTPFNLFFLPGFLWYSH